MPKQTPPSRRTGKASSHSRAFEALLSGVEAVTSTTFGLSPARFVGNEDETDYADKSATFSKGLAQRGPGRVDPEAFRNFRNALNARADLELTGDCAVAPPPPKVSSPEYATELVELYWASLLRDKPFCHFESEVTAIAAARELDGLGDAYRGPRDSEGRVTTKTLFRGGLRRAGKTYFAGETFGPYISQLLIHPARLGAQPLDQKFRTHRAGVDYLTEEGDWAWIQNGGLASEMLNSDPVRRYLKDGRGLSAYAYADLIFHTYFVANRVMAELGLDANPGSPHAGQLNRKRPSPLDAPDIVGMLNAAARAALDAVSPQIWAVHLRHSPEAGAGLLHLAKTHRAATILKRATGGADSLHEIVMSSPAVKFSYMKHGAYLLSQAFPEGAPAHPSYPSDRAVIAGACVTVLKFFYDCERAFTGHGQVLEPSADGLSLKPYPGMDAAQMTFNTELSKLAHNVAFGHGLHAGANWRSDIDEGLLLGEASAIEFLKVRARLSRHRFSVRIRKFDGEQETIGN